MSFATTGKMYQTSLFHGTTPSTTTHPISREPNIELQPSLTTSLSYLDHLFPINGQSTKNVPISITDAQDYKHHHELTHMVTSNAPTTTSDSIQMDSNIPRFNTFPPMTLPLSYNNHLPNEQEDVDVRSSVMNEQHSNYETTPSYFAFSPYIILQSDTQTSTQHNQVNEKYEQPIPQVTNIMNTSLPVNKTVTHSILNQNEHSKIWFMILCTFSGLTFLSLSTISIFYCIKIRRRHNNHDNSGTIYTNPSYQFLLADDMAMETDV